ncbi:serine-rich coiled-coil domain-containing protein 2 isoform X2 [Anas platyrhynchos]|uniref:Coiled-coil serine rich protein 2 n=1 Tax=Anas platyrhynchos platyrhynchos TaxID=8840 RepID=A0A493SXD5_ANAPP|nr:serine-rich coiled-coil domain-containing protein 2 isoform X2 [Anas platyrhynchos]
MEEKNQTRTSLVSRLPKYGTKTLGSVLQPMPNGSAVNLAGNNGGKNFSKHNGTVGMSSFSFNWRKSNKHQLHDQNERDTNSKHNCNEKLIDSEKYSPSQGALSNDVLRVGLNNTASVASKTVKQNNMFVPSTEELNPKSLPGLSSSAKFAKGTLSGRTSFSGLSAPKSHLNGFYGNRPMVGLQRPRANSSATRTSSGESFAQSTDNNKPFSSEKMVRSQSFSHSIQNSFLPTTSLTRSHSFNKAVDLTRPYSQNLAVRTSQRSSLLSRNARQLDVPNGNEPMKYGFTRPYSGISAPASKKPPLTNGSGSTPSFGYRLSRPSLLKPTRQRFAGNIIVDDGKTTTPDTCIVENSEIATNINRAIDKNSIIECDARRTESVNGLHESTGKHGSSVMCMSDDGDEISISSLSSSEKNDLSEDFSDDFIDIEDPNRTVQLQQKESRVQELEHGSITSIEPFTSLKESGGSCCNADDWLDINMSVDDNSESTKNTAESVISPEINYRAGSSFELSPSDSSDGTYMWDEEGLEPIGSVHPCGSYESSEMNSIDILNNLDSCDLEDDDLMLDVDLPEDPPHDKEECENMSRYDRQDRNARQHPEGFWKRAPQQRWNAQDHYHLGHTENYIHGKNDLNRRSNYPESPVGHFESYGAPNCYQAPRQLVGLPENTVMLDEMTLQHMVQDCTAVKTQLLKLKRLLHQNDENVSLEDITLSIPSSPEPQEPETTYSKTEDLVNEIRKLKDELKKKDETINQLEHQLATRCNCQRDNQKSSGVTSVCADKFTQTSWRRSSPQVLQPSSSLPSSTDLAQGKLVKMPHIEAHSEYSKYGVHENGNHENQNAANVSLTNSLNDVNTSMNIQLNVKDKSTSYLENMKNKNTEDPGEVASNKEGTLSRSCFQTSARDDAREVQTELAVKGQPSFTYQASWPKTLKITKPPNALVPPTAAVLTRSANHSAASKEPELLPSSSSTQLQPTSGPDDLKGKQSQKVSKLRPPTMSFVKSKQTSSQKSTPVSQEPQNTCLKTNIPKPPVQRKENVQTQNTVVHSGDSLLSNRYSRLPKPKTH